jgi:chromosome segregation ATPase
MKLATFRDELKSTKTALSEQQMENATLQDKLKSATAAISEVEGKWKSTTAALSEQQRENETLQDKLKWTTAAHEKVIAANQENLMMKRKSSRPLVSQLLRPTNGCLFLDWMTTSHARKDVGESRKKRSRDFVLAVLVGEPSKRPLVVP